MREEREEREKEERERERKARERERERKIAAASGVASYFFINLEQIGDGKLKLLAP